MNRIIGIAVIFLAIFATPSAFALEKVDEIAPLQIPNGQEVIEIDITKIEDNSDKKSQKEKRDYYERDTVLENADVEFSMFDNLLDKDPDFEHPFKIEEESLFGKIYKKDITRTSIPSYLLKDELTFKYKKGPIDRVQFYGAFQGNINSLFRPSDYDTEYDLNVLETGMIGGFKDKKTDFKLQFNFKNSSNYTFLQGLVTDAYIMNTRIPHHKIIIGNSRNQVGVDGGATTYTLPFAFRSQIARNFGNTRALGVRVVGNYDLVDYSMAMNTSDRFFRSFFSGPEFTGWVNLKPLGKTDGKYGKLVVGSGINAGRAQDNYVVGGAYVGYTYKKFMANFEYAIADGYNGVQYSSNKATGFYSTISYRLTQKLHLLARYDQFDPNRDISGDMRREYTAGINYFIKGQALRLILNYVFCQNERTEDSHRIIFGTQIVL